MPTYAKDGAVICIFKNTGKFNASYHNLGFSAKANLDKGGVCASEFALIKSTAAEGRKSHLS